MGFNLSGPAAFPGLRFFNNFKIPSTEITNSSIGRVGLKIPAGTECRLSNPSSNISWTFIVLSRERDRGAFIVKQAGTVVSVY